MERIPEEELMDKALQANAYAEADFSEPHDAFVVHFARFFPDFSGDRVLDLGCGTADVTIRFARAFPGTHITGVDGAQAMLDLGMRGVQLQGLTHRITLQKCRIPDSELHKQKFDAIISNSLLHHLADSTVLWQTVKGCAKPGALIFIMDLLRPDSIETAKELVKQYAADEPEILQKDFYNSLLAAYKAEEVQRQLHTAQLECLTIETAGDRHWIARGKMRS